MFSHGFLGPGGPFVMILFWAAVIAAMVYALRFISSAASEEAPQYEPSPMDVLKRRYAKGEINSEEYIRMKENLGSK